MAYRYDKKAIRRLLSERNWTDEDAAKRARLAPRTVTYLERGTTEPRASTLAKLCTAFGVGPETFIVQHGSGS